MAPPDEFRGETHGRRNGPSAVDHRQQEPGTAMPQLFSHQRPALARSRCAALTISISSTMTISSLIGVAQQVGAERQRAFVVAPQQIILGCVNCNKLVRLGIPKRAAVTRSLTIDS